VQKEVPLQIFACIADWDRLQQYQQVHGPEMGEVDESWYREDSFTSWNDSFSFNQKVSESFLEIRGRLPKRAAERLEQFLVTFCPALASESAFAPPQDVDVWPEEFHAAVSPQEVRQRLALLDGLELPRFFALFYDLFLDGQPNRREFALAREREVVEFFFMWSSALGQAASKGWGLVVVIA
jgi:hypothetical protein